LLLEQAERAGAGDGLGAVGRAELAQMRSGRTVCRHAREQRSRPSCLTEVVGQTLLEL
jgi:hypothetical protein